MNIPATPANRALASAVNRRIQADGAMLAARAAAARLGGLGVLVLASGLAVGAAFYGWSFVADSRTSADKMANAFVRALDGANLGRVRLDTDGATVKVEPLTLDPGATVHLDPGAQVRLAAAPGNAAPNGPAGSSPGSRASRDPVPPRVEREAVPQREDREAVPQRPTSQQSAADAKPQSRAKVVSNYTVFKSVAFGDGEVVTGWNYGTSEEAAPVQQYCRFMKNSGDGVHTIIDLATDGQFKSSALAFPEIDARMAATNCVWFWG